MGTRSTVKFYRRGKCLLALYNQYDGYYEGVGQELVEFFENKENMGNGFEDTALLYVCYKKQGKPYHTYLTTENDFEEFNYVITETDEGLEFTIYKELYLEEGVAYQRVLQWADFEEFKKFIKEHSRIEEE